ncbi:MAG: alanine--glyoxylate aminotransferase family protein [Gammaproteobacteria bacterium]|nr:alanine--glyoxylate aminotransferase family protein [Gammaproteobacteria bacterium]
MSHKSILLTTGITPLPAEVRLAMCRPMIDGHGEEALAIIGGILQRIQRLMGTAAKVFLFPASGTGALEASIVNHLSPGDEVLVCVNGFFSGLYAEIARAHGLNVVELWFPQGEGVNWVKVIDFLQGAGQKVRAILITHHETSTGALTDMRGIRELRRHSDALIMLNVLSSLGGTPVLLDEWGVDVAVGASHKGLMCPPGVAFVAVNPRAEEAWQESSIARAYWDLRRLSHWMEQGVVPFDPPLPVLYALDRALPLFFDAADKRQAIYERIQTNALTFRDGLSDTGATLIAPPAHRAPNASVVRIPTTRSASMVRATLRERFGIYVSPGIGELADATIRVNHQGYVSAKQTIAVTQALQTILYAPRATHESKNNVATESVPQEAP